MIKVETHSDIVWERCEDCENLVNSTVTIGSKKSKLCYRCLDELKQKLNAIDIPQESEPTES